MDEIRLNRGLTQRLYLLNAELIDKNNWKFNVEGSTGTEYTLFLSEEIISCSCPDFTRRKKLCKHLYFILSRVLQQTDLIQKINGYTNTNIFSINENLSTVIESTLFKNNENTEHTEHEEHENKNSEIPENDICSICFDEFGKEECLKCCICRNYFHKQCIKRWNKNKNTCPLCRSTVNTWSSDDISNPLEKFKIKN